MDTMLKAHSVPDAEVAPGALQALRPRGTSPYLFDAHQFFEMIEAGVFPREARVFLWDGMVCQKMAKKRPHGIAGAKFVQSLARVLPPDWFLSPEDSVVAGPARVPLPDLIVVRGVPDDYARRLPIAADVGLVIELAYSSLKQDLGEKLRGYAGAGFENYWVANLIDHKIIAHHDPIPEEERYAMTRIYERGEQIPLLLDGRDVGPIAVDSLLPL